MKKGLILLLGIALLAYVGFAIAGTDNEGIQTTPHDLPNEIGGSAAGAEPCAFCHTPHVPDVLDNNNQLIYPLWNRSQASQTYTMYSTPTHDMFDTNTKTSANLDASTRACMQCHNGANSVLINYPGRGPNTGSADASKYQPIASWWANSGNLGTNLKPDHPVGFSYVDTEDLDNNGFPAIASGKIDGVLPMYTLTEKASGSTGMLGCATCHEPHDRFLYNGKADYGSGTGTQVFFLRNSTGSTGSNTTNGGNADSALCRVCHVNRY